MTRLETILPIPDLCWEGDRFAPPLGVGDAAALSRLEGQFARAVAGDGKVLLARDRFGVHKLFFAVREDGTVVAANYIIDLLRKARVPFEAIFSVPSGHFTLLDAAARRLETRRYHEPRVAPPADPSLEGIGRALRAALEGAFARLAHHFGDREVCLCLSGGLDSSLIAALARRHFREVRGFTYTFVADDHPESEDADYARRVAAHLGMRVDMIPATREDILDCVDDALVYGQDWRDFNLHCAIVNELIARHVAAHPSGNRRLLLTGDMMNEIVADYTPIAFRGREYYRLPDIGIDRLRLTLIQGLDSGDREIGVFQRHGLDAIQPYGLVVEDYLKIPGTLLQQESAKQRLVRAVASDLLPDFVLRRAKVRAQIGTSEQPTGILPILMDAGRDSAFLKQRWRELYGIENLASQDRLIRAGCYRIASSFPDRTIRGYLA